jgi:hypothetical protein
MKNLKLIITFFFAFAISYCQAQENCVRLRKTVLR